VSRTSEVEQLYRGALAFCGVTLLITVFLYISDSTNPSNRYFLIAMFVVFTLTATFSSFVVKDFYLSEMKPIYWAFVWGFNVLVVLFVILVSLQSVVPTTHLEKTGLIINLNKIIWGSIIIEFLMDLWAYLDYGYGLDADIRLVAVLFILLELTLLVMAIVPSFELFSFDAIMLAGVLSCAHFLQTFND